MASKHAQSGAYDPSAPGQSPPLISLSDKLFSSVISLPDQPCIVYAVFTPLPGSAQHPHDSLELARRKVLDHNASRPLLDSWLPSVLVRHESALYLYSIVPQDHSAQRQSEINTLLFDGLHASETSCFTPKDIYPCSLSCATQRIPCQTCLESQLQPHSPTSSSSSSVSSAACFLPRRPLRQIFSQFLEALRNRLINDISNLSKNDINFRPVLRFRDGFLLGPIPVVSECRLAQRNSPTRPFIYCHLDILLTPSRIIIHPILRPTHFLLCNSLPLAPGTPITLVPYAVPAYFLSTYSGPISALTAQFDESLSGLGVGEWKPPSPFITTTSSEMDTNCGPSDSSAASYVIAWVNVENKQGEDKGMTVIWPARLCLSFLPSSPSAHARTSLSYLPQLSPQLQSSPIIPSTSTHTVQTDQKSHLSISPSSSSVAGLRRTPTSDSLRAFRLLTLSLSKDIKRIATEVGRYVDAVAKEREKERERIRREREMASTSASPRAVSTSAAPAPGPSHSIITPGPTPGEMRTDEHVTAAAPTTSIQVQSSISPIQQHHPNQHFYPSPPQSNLPPSDAADAMNTSPEVSVTPLPDVQGPVPQLPVDVPPTSSSTPFDPFTSIASGTTWSQQPTSDFLGMDVDFGMGEFDLGMDPVAGGGGGDSAIYDRRSMEREDAFTDDDFSFFDRPSRAVPVNTSIPLSIDANLTTATDPVPLTYPSPLFSAAIHSSGPGPPAFTMTQSNLSSPWAPGPLGDAFTPRFAETEVSHPDTFSPSPSQTHWSRSAPSSPIVQLSYDHNRPDSSRPSPSRGPSIFDPIPFAPSHRLSDGKYAVGKFALPSPPDEEDRTESFPMLPSSSSPQTDGWKNRYKAATDPRIGVVRNLKRKSLDQGVRKKMKLFLGREQDNSADSPEADKSEADSDEEIEESDSPVVSSRSTPPPAYLPSGPALLHTQFQHCHLLPLTTPLRPPGAAVAPTNITSPPAAISVPTPVSPAAVIGAATEKSKSLETAAQAVAREVVENAVWANAWRANISGSLSTQKRSLDIWQADIVAVKQLFEGIPALENALDVAAVFQAEAQPSVHDGDTEKPLRSMDSPMISVAKGDAIIQILPTALRFWEKLGLGPRSGEKDVSAFVLFEGEDNERLQQAERWLENMSTVYTGKRFGSHTAGSCSATLKAGLIPLRFDALRKNILNLVANLANFEEHLVFYVVIPANAMTLASPLLRQVLSAVKRSLKSCPSVPLFQFVPEYIVFGSLEDPSAYNSHMETLCFSIYDRIMQPVKRVISRPFFENGEKVQNFIQDPSFALGRPMHNKVKFLWQAPARSLDVLDRYTLLHVGYQITPCGKWILAACVDERGEAHDIGVWLTQSEGNDAHVISQVWDFMLHFARKANVEWRVVIAKLGCMKENELNAWMVHLANTISASPNLSMLHVFLLCVDPDVPWTFTMPQNQKRPSTPRRPSTRDKLGFVIVDSSASTYGLFCNSRMPLSSAPSSSRDLYTDLCFVAEADDVSEPEEPGILPLATSTLVRVPSQLGLVSISMLQIHFLHSIKSSHSSLKIPDWETHADITKNYHDLALLTRYRWRMDVNPILPFHLAALEAMQIALDRGDSMVD